MGGGISKKDKAECMVVVNKTMAKTMAAFEIPDKDIFPLWRIFEDIDVDGSGSIELGEMMKHYGLPHSAFTQRVFARLDVSGDNHIDFSG